jgi:RNA polymerase sigma-70 factor (ECF subfamily)
MKPPSPDSLTALSRSLAPPWHRFLDVYEPLRPDLYRYCRYLTRTPWDAEDLAQDSLARAFATLASMTDEIPNPRAWLFRVASNLWIDRVRRVQNEPRLVVDGVPAPDPRAPREAAATLIAQLSPQERSAVVLKDVFDLSLEEIAQVLSTTVGGVKAALHRGRGKLVEPDAVELHPPAPAVLDAFCDAFNARDLDRLTAVLLDTAEIEVVGVHTEYGPEAARGGVFAGMLFGSARMAEAETRGGMDPAFKARVRPVPPRMEVRVHRGEALLVHWYEHEDGEAVRAITRVTAEGDRISRVRNYFFTPEFLSDLCAELELPCRVNGYRFWLPEGDA